LFARRRRRWLIRQPIFDTPPPPYHIAAITRRRWRASVYAKVTLLPSRRDVCRERDAAWRGSADARRARATIQRVYFALSPTLYSSLLMPIDIAAAPPRRHFAAFFGAAIR
jgi:hypothetical protein